MDRKSGTKGRLGPSERVRSDRSGPRSVRGVSTGGEAVVVREKNCQFPCRIVLGPAIGAGNRSL